MNKMIIFKAIPMLLLATSLFTSCVSSYRYGGTTNLSNINGKDQEWVERIISNSMIYDRPVEKYSDRYGKRYSMPTDKPDLIIPKGTKVKFVALYSRGTNMGGASSFETVFETVPWEKFPRKVLISIFD